MKIKEKALIDDNILIVPNLLSDQECQKYITLSEQIGYTETVFPTSRGLHQRPEIRNNSYVALNDAALATNLWQRLAAYLSPAVGLNQQWQFYRYNRHQKFTLHRDCPHRCGNYVSQFTFLVYLNQEFVGGETYFPEFSLKILPKTGMAVLFRHHLLHTAMEVTTGLKYALRSDVMYAK